MSGLLSGRDEAALRAKLATEPFAAALRRMVARVHAAAARDELAPPYTATPWCHSHFVTPCVLEAGFVARLTGDETAVEHVRRQVRKLAQLHTDPPASVIAGIGKYSGRPSTYSSNAHTCLAVDLARAQLGDAAMQEALTLVRTRLIADQLDSAYFFTHFNAGHNAVTTHAIAAGICALTLGEEAGHPETARVMALARDACEQHVVWGYDDEGVPHEGPMYSLVVLDWVYLFVDLLRRAGGEDLFATLPKLAVIADAYRSLQLPGGLGVPGFDDSRSLTVSHPLPWLLLTAAAYDRPEDLAYWYEHQDLVCPGDPEVQARESILYRCTTAHWPDLRELLWWDGTEPAAPCPPPPLAYVGLGKAVALLRSSRTEDAVCLTVLGQGRSRNIPDHAHADAGDFSILAHGDLLACDTGYFNFNEDMHSVVLIDGTPHSPTTKGNLHSGRFSRVATTDWLDVLTIEAAAAKGCIWADRHVLFLRGPGDAVCVVTLDNINRDNGVHEFAWQLQAGPHCAVAVTGDTTATVTGRAGRLDCHFVSPLAADFPTSPHSLDVRAETRPRRDILTGIAAPQPCLAAAQTGPNCTLMSVLIPRPVDAPPLVVTSRPALRTFDVTVDHGDYRDRIVWGCDHSYIRLPDLTLCAEIAVFRSAPDGSPIARWTSA